MEAFAYADDITLLVHTKSAMYKLLHIAKEFSKWYNLYLSPAKSVLKVYTLDLFDQNRNVAFNGMSINFVIQHIHLTWAA